MDQIVRIKRLIDYPRYKPCLQATWIFWDIISRDTKKLILLNFKVDVVFYLEDLVFVCYCSNYLFLNCFRLKQH
jgi:hypothetical protein